MILVPAAAVYFLSSIDSFADFVTNSVGLPVQWQTVDDWQWYMLWLTTTLYVSVGLAGLYFLRRAFANFAKGELFNLANSRDLRRFSVLLFAQGLAKPLHLAVSSVLLSANHPTGEKMLSSSFGTNELLVIAFAMVLWVMSDLLIEGCNLQSENRQFV